MTFENILSFYYSNNSILGNKTNFVKKRKNICWNIEKMGNVIYWKKENWNWFYARKKTPTKIVKLKLEKNLWRGSLKIILDWKVPKKREIIIPVVSEK